MGLVILLVGVPMLYIKDSGLVTQHRPRWVSCLHATTVVRGLSANCAWLRYR